MENACPNEDTPASKRKKLSLSLSRSFGKRTVPLKDVGNSGNSKQFASPVKEKEYIEAGKGVVPTNTKQCNEWALRPLQVWATQRNAAAKSEDQDCVSSNILETDDRELVAKFMRYFVL